MALLPVGAEQQRDTPQARQTHQGIDDPGEDGQLPAAEEGHRVKAEQADAALVQGADDDQNQGKFVQKHMKTSISLAEYGLVWHACKKMIHPDCKWSASVV